LLVGRRRNPHTPGIFHKLSLIAFFAWVGLGADGLSSSCYGPQEAYLALGHHTHLSIFVALMTVVTIMLISASYSQIIELFPTGGGGYLVASKLLSPRVGMISGCALLIDYVLTITVSIASGADAVFSFLPATWAGFRLVFAMGGVLLLTVLNLRGVKESVLPLVPIFLVFVVTHLIVILYVMGTHVLGFERLMTSLSSDFHATKSELGTFGILLLLMRAYGMGAGTFTGIEAVSNAVPILREPKVETAKRTMLYMALSLSITVFGLMVGFLLFNVTFQPGKTLNAMLFQQLTAHWPPAVGGGFVLITLLSEAALLFVAAQTGFLGGPSVLATMAKDQWVPTRFALLSDRLVVQNGILLIGAAALLAMVLTNGSVHVLVILYSINVFITFTLSQFGMVRYWLKSAIPKVQRIKKLLVNGSGLVLTLLILFCLITVKFHEGGWITLAITSGFVVFVTRIKAHYRQTAGNLRRLDELIPVVESSLTTHQPEKPGDGKRRTSDRTAILLVNGYGGIGLHSLLSIFRLFGAETFGRFIFLQVGVIDVEAFKGIEQIKTLEDYTQSEVQRYVSLMRRHGFESEGIAVTGLDIAEEVTNIAARLQREHPQAVFFGGQLVFEKNTLWTRWLHNYVTFDIQRRLYQRGIQFVILPIRA